MTGRGRSRACIAIINDDAVHAEVVQSLLVEEGFEAVVCPEWGEAGAFVVHEQPDLVLLDVRRGEVERAWCVLDHLALDPLTRRIPVILWSGAHQALQARIAAVRPQHGIFTLSKPFDLDTLLDRIWQALVEYPPSCGLTARRLAQDSERHLALNRLTAREWEVAQLIARGETNRQIAQALVLTPG